MGLIAFFPIFNQVAETSQDALRDADHKAKFKDFIKSWDDIPEDEKLSYWDGKSQPPGQQGDFDDSKIDKDGNFDEPKQPPPPDRDGDGVPDQDDPDPDDARVHDDESAQKMRTEVVQLHQFVGEDRPLRDGPGEDVSVERPGDDGEEWVLEHVWVEWEIDSFSGTYQFRLSDEKAQRWAEDSGNGQLPRADHDEPKTSSEPFEPATDMKFSYDYAPITGTAPDTFVVTVWAQYRVYTS